MKKNSGFRMWFVENYVDEKTGKSQNALEISFTKEFNAGNAVLKGDIHMIYTSDTLELAKKHLYTDEKNQMFKVAEDFCTECMETLWLERNKPIKTSK